MANYCSVNAYIPLQDIPEEQERNKLTALYNAELAYRKAIEQNEDLRRGSRRDEFISSQPGVPSNYTRWSNRGGYFQGRDGEKLLPKSKQWRKPTVGAHFREYNNQIYTFVYNTESHEGITVRPYKEKTQITYLKLSESYRYSYPWWVEVSFAGGLKHCDETSKEEDVQEALESGESICPYPFLLWEIPLEKAVKNLEYVIDVYSKLPIHGYWYEYSVLYYQMNELSNYYRWLKSILLLFPTALVVMDYAEVNMMLTFDEARKDNSPNEILTSIKKLEEEIKTLPEDSIYDKHKDKEFIPIKLRNPFKGLDW